MITSQTTRRGTRAAPKMAPTLHSVVTRTEARDCRWEAVWADRYAEVVESAPATESDRPYACLKGTAAMSTESAAAPAMTYRLVSMPILVCAQLGSSPNELDDRCAPSGSGCSGLVRSQAPSGAWWLLCASSCHLPGRRSDGLCFFRPIHEWVSSGGDVWSDGFLSPPSKSMSKIDRQYVLTWSLVQ